ncbi:MAG TPA: lysylphosphatidylglycerol synthase transmembrane domain-containing protein [Gemmatimonadales bacterium]|nr:lysylphosphatidylglycerol synthase transmembrane domain-containing protein [Gemmatimonadales bacterium]
MPLRLPATRGVWLRLVLAILLVALAIRFARGYAWEETLDALRDASWPLLGLATVINLASLGAKGWAWHLLLLPYAPHRWRSAQVATFGGAAVNCVGVSVGGEAVRAHVLATRDRVPLGAVVGTIVVSRVVEGLALVVFLAVVAGFLPPAPWVRPVQLGLWALTAALLALTTLGAWSRLLARMPAWLRQALAPLAAEGAGRRLLAPLALDVVNWICEWLTFHYCLLATGIAVSPIVALTALVAANVGGILRLTPGNVGVIQGALLLALAPFDVDPQRGLAAGLALQAVQTIPVILFGVLVAGRPTLRAFAGRTLTESS